MFPFAVHSFCFSGSSQLLSVQKGYTHLVVAEGVTSRAESLEPNADLVSLSDYESD